MIDKSIVDKELLNAAFKGTFGLERETLRISEDGFLSDKPHPFKETYIDRDFCESQIEIISPVCHSINELHEEITKIDREVKSRLRQKDISEYPWIFSNPPYIKSDDSIHIAQYQGELASKTRYREYLGKKYGKRKMLFCGIHFNFGYSDEFVELLSKKLGINNLQLLKNKLYLELSKKIELYSWLLVFLTAASPVFDNSFAEKDSYGKTYFTGEASMRSGEDGYWNDFVPIIDYTSIESYVDSVEKYIFGGKLFAPSEWYTPVRIKPRGLNSFDLLRQNGANHIELRMLDVNPLFNIGIGRKDLEFIHLFLYYLTFMKSENFEEFEQINAVYNHKEASLFNVDNLIIKLHGNETLIEEAALKFLDNMENFLSDYGQPEADSDIISEMKNRCLRKENRYADRVYSYFCDDYVGKGIELMKYYSKEGSGNFDDYITLLSERKGD